MTLDALLAILHHWLAFGLVGLVMAEWAILRGAACADTVRRIARVDLFYGIVAGLLLLVGIARVVYGAKGLAFYTGNPVFWLKVALFALAGGASIVPTIRFIRWSRANQASGALPEAAAWQSTRKLVVWELHALAGVMICAALTARGIGH
ncbi:MAG: DUF2214 family protein [Burkholderiales bacterium]|nr:DUF2214 family protein [Burkholderiales bacterium]